MGDFEKLFEEYGGDYNVTMTRFMGKRSVYMKIFGMLFQDENLQVLGTALRAGDLDTAFMAAHTLKGVTGNLGLTPYYDAVYPMVEPLRNREEGMDYLEMYQRVLEEFAKVEALWGELQAVALQVTE